MTSISFTQFRKNLAYFLSIAQEDFEEIVVSRGKGRNAVILSLDEFTSLQETAHLLSSKNNRKHLAKSLKDVDDGSTVSISIT